MVSRPQGPPDLGHSKSERTASVQTSMHRTGPSRGTAGLATVSADQQESSQHVHASLGAPSRCVTSDRHTFETLASFFWAGGWCRCMGKLNAGSAKSGYIWRYECASGTVTGFGPRWRVKHAYSTSRFRSPVRSIHQAPPASVNTMKPCIGAPDIARSKMSPPWQGSGHPDNACVPMGRDSETCRPATRL